MRVLLFLNELSCGAEIDTRQAATAMNELVDTLLAVRTRRPDAALVTADPVTDLTIAAGYHIRQWLGADRRNRDRQRLLLGMRNRAPFSAVLPDGASGEGEYTHQGRSGRAFQAADLTDGLVVSLPVADEWRCHTLDVTRTQLEETEDGGTECQDTTIQLRHSSCPGHVEHHDNWIRNSGLSGICTGMELWEYRETFFPHLSFLPRVEGDLRDLKEAWVGPVRRRLAELEEAVAAWDPEESRTPQYRSKETGESQSRRQRGVVRFTDLDGEPRLFEEHLRFTPGAGRVYFRLVPQDRRVTVASIGAKRE